jgi:probable LLM family oxidoreductase
MAKNSLGDKVSSSSDQYREPSVSKVIKSTSKVEAGSKRIRNRSNMQVGIDSFAAAFGGESASLTVISPSERLQNLVEQIEYADQVGLDVFGVGEHHRQEFLDSAPALILAAAAARTQRIRLTSAVTVLSAADPVRVFQEFATLDLLSQGRAEMVVGRGSFIEAFPLFGLRLEDYDSLFAEKLNLLLKVRDNERVYWSGEYRPPLTGQGIYPRPLQNPFPIWLGVGGTPQSFVRAGVLGLPLMVAIIGGETRQFRPLIDLYREAGRRAGHSPDQLKVGIHSLGYVADTMQEAVDDFFPGYAHTMSEIGKERGWRPMTRAGFDAQRGPQGALLVGDPGEVVRKIVRHSKALGGGISRITFQMDPGSLSQEKLMRAIKLIGTRVVPALREELDIDESEKEEFNKIPNA